MFHNNNKSNNSFVLFRYPYAKTATLYVHGETAPHFFYDYTELNRERGFVFSPFKPTKEQPILLLSANHVETIPLHENVEKQPLLLMESRGDRLSYSQDFEYFHSQIKAGSFSKIVLSRNEEHVFDKEINAEKLFYLACTYYTRAFVSLFYTPQAGYWLTATPELLLSFDGNCYHTMALAGTMSYSDNIDWSTKNKEEQSMVTSYIRKTLSSYITSIVESTPYTVRAGNLAHLRSDFTFSLKENYGIGDVIRELHPTPAVCGLPKKETYDFILSHESNRREYYTGFLGNIGFGNEQKIYVNLRCMKISSKTCRLYSGSGLLLESNEGEEWLETCDKLNTMKRLFAF